MCMRKLYKTLMALAIAALAAGPAIADDKPTDKGQTFYGFIVDELLGSDKFGQGDHGFVSFNTGDPDTVVVNLEKKTSFMFDPLMSAGEYFDGKIYAFMFKWREDYEGYYTYSYDIYDANTFELLKRIDKAYDRRVLDMTYDATTNTMYAIAEDEEGLETSSTESTSLYVVDMSTGNLTRVGSAGDLIGTNGYGKKVPDNLVNIAADKDGNLYSMTEYRHFYKVDKLTGKATEIGTEHKLATQNDFQSMTFGADGVLYWAQFTPHPYSWLTTIDPTTGVPTKHCTIGRNAHITGLFQRRADDTAFPQAVTDLKSVNDATKHNLVTLTWANPTKNVDGTDANVTAIRIYRFGTTEAIAEVPAGTTSYVVDEPNNGYLSYEVVPMSGTVHGTPAFVTQFAGSDQMKGVNNVNTLIDGNNVTITWEKPTETVNGKWADFDNITYNVYRVNLGTGNYIRVSQEQAGLTYSETLNEDGYYCYVIEAVSSGIIGLGARSADFTISSTKHIPYSTGFEDTDDTELWTIKNNNAKFYGWSFTKPYNMPIYGKSAQLYAGGSSSPCDDWLISPAIQIEPGTYKLSYDASTSLGKCSWEILLGIDANDLTSFSQSLDRQENVEYKTEWKHVEKTFTIDQPHIYYLGIHGFTTDTFTKGFIDNISITNATDGISGVSAATDGKISITGATATVNAPKPVGTWTVTNIAGQTVMSGNGNGAANVQIGLAPLAQGTYIVSATLSDGKKLTAKVRR